MFVNDLLLRFCIVSFIERPAELVEELEAGQHQFFKLHLLSLLDGKMFEDAVFRCPDAVNGQHVAFNLLLFSFHAFPIVVDQENCDGADQQSDNIFKVSSYFQAVTRKSSLLFIIFPLGGGC